MTTHDERDLPLFDPAQPDEQFQARLREQFVSGAFASAPGDAESEDQLRRDAAALRPALASDPADEAFAARLRGAFVAGSLDASSVRADSPAAHAPMAEQPGPEPEVELRPAAPIHSFARRRFVQAAVAIAAALAIFVTIGLTGTSGWRVYNNETAAVLVDDDPFKGSKIAPGSRVCLLCTEDENLRLGYEDVFRLELAANTRVRMPEPRDENGRLILPVTVEKGELVFISQSVDRPTSVVIDTKNAFIELRGTAVSVLPLPDGSTCICVREGEVEVESMNGDRGTVVAGAGQRVFVAADGTVSVADDFEDETRLANLHAACEDLDAGRFEQANYARSWNALEQY